jgi:hypothetical protein
MSVALQVNYFTPIQSVKMPFLTEYMLADSIENNTIHIRQESSLQHEPSNWKGKKQNLKVIDPAAKVVSSYYNRQRSK